MSKLPKEHNWKVDPFKKTSVAFQKDDFKLLQSLMKKWDSSQSEAIKRCIKIAHSELIK